MTILYHVTQLAIVFFMFSLTAWMWLFCWAFTIYGYGWTRSRMRAGKAFWCMVISAPVAGALALVSIILTEAR